MNPFLIWAYGVAVVLLAGWLVAVYTIVSLPLRQKPRAILDYVRLGTWPPVVRDLWLIVVTPFIVGGIVIVAPLIAYWISGDPQLGNASIARVPVLTYLFAGWIMTIIIVMLGESPPRVPSLRPIHRVADLLFLPGTYTMMTSALWWIHRDDEPTNLWAVSALATIGVLLVPVLVARVLQPLITPSLSPALRLVFIAGPTLAGVTVMALFGVDLRISVWINLATTAPILSASLISSAEDVSPAF